MTDLAVRVTDLEVRVGRRNILGPISLEVQSGEHALVVGPSGSGKTTLLRAIAGLTRTHAGRITLFGRVASEEGKERLAPAERGIGFLFQRGGLWPHMTARKHLEFVLGLAGVKGAERKARIGELFEMVELTGLERRKPAELSGGEAQRLALARAIATRPRLLLLDEPLGPLDAELRASLLERLDAVQQELGVTMLHVTHDPDEARHVAGRTLRLSGGVLAEEEHHQTSGVRD